MQSNNKSEFLINFGKNLTKLREAQQLTKVQLAFELEIGEKHLRRIEKGELNIGIVLLVKISQSLEIEMKELFDF